MLIQPKAIVNKFTEHNFYRKLGSEVTERCNSLAWNGVVMRAKHWPRRFRCYKISAEALEKALLVFLNYQHNFSDKDIEFTLTADYFCL
jgi:hypothetical protein